MSKRLDLLYEMIPQNGKGIIDVGTDHGIIPIRLALSGYAGNIIASDIGIGPLKSAELNASSRGVQNKIQFRLCDGLDLCNPDEIDCILIAGMGGDTICGILDRAEWIFDASYTFLFQPMTKPEVLRYWLIHNEFMINQEGLVQEDGHIYQIIRASLGKSKSMLDAEYMIGSRTTDRTGAPLKLLIEHDLNILTKMLNGFSASTTPENPPAYRFYSNIKAELYDMYLMLTEN